MEQRKLNESFKIVYRIHKTSLMAFLIKIRKYLITFLTHDILGTGLPEALHSSVTVLPLRAVKCPVSGFGRIAGGTIIKKINYYLNKEIKRSFNYLKFQLYELNHDFLDHLFGNCNLQHLVVVHL